MRQNPYDRWCLKCGMMHPAEEGTTGSLLDMDSGWSARVGDGRWVVLCPECSEWEEAITRARMERDSGESRMR